MGGGLVLISFKSSEDMAHSIHINNGRLADLFESLEPWSPNAVSHERISWLTCYGIPLHVWEKEFFSNLGSLFGRFLGIDENTEDKASFDCARILVCIKERSPINRTVRIKVDGDDFDVILFEEPVVEWESLFANTNIALHGFESTPDSENPSNAEDDTPISNAEDDTPTPNAENPSNTENYLPHNHAVTANGDGPNKLLRKNPSPSDQDDTPTSNTTNQVAPPSPLFVISNTNSKTTNTTNFPLSKNLPSPQARLSNNSPHTSPPHDQLYPPSSENQESLDLLDLDNIPLARLMHFSRLEKRNKKKHKASKVAPFPSSNLTTFQPKKPLKRPKKMSLTFKQNFSSDDFQFEPNPIHTPQVRHSLLNTPTSLSSPTSSPIPSKGLDHPELDPTWRVGEILNITEGFTKEQLLAELSLVSNPSSSC
ncbi:hypothetical protein Tsubulata_046626 [Turnera subulata]|uniref:DUF4283 domain-containing protein n=1 Tax=Turnera subulata TaxID=218843 RepID=A0A9Q0FSU6_9ROSI|nr:hypothetical protein Tsubulata_046626 [Turnera subulata]